jgi:hypothetical protein
MTDDVYLLIQASMVFLLLCVDGLTALVQHPEWFQ